MARLPDTIIMKFEPRSLEAMVRLRIALEEITARLSAPKPAAPKAKKATTATVNPLRYFEGFWEVWPKKTAKQAAQKVWRALNPNPILYERIFKDVQARAASRDWLKDGGQFIPNPATYINGRRWEDEGAETGDGGGSAGKEAY